MHYGHFSDDGREYVITTPNTPHPWVNFLTNGDYCALCSHVGGGFSFYLDHRVNAVMERGLHQSSDDVPGRFVYIKDEDTGEVWNANAHPIGKHDTFEARHAVAETTIKSSYAEIASELSFVVHPDVQAESWGIVLRNTGDRPRKLSVYSTAAICPGNVSSFEGCPEFHGLCNHVRRDDFGFVLGNSFWFPDYGWSEEQRPWDYEIYMTSTARPARLCLDRNVFFGPMRSYHNPVGVETEWLPEADGNGRQVTAVYQWRIELAPEAEWTTYLALGVQPANADADSRIAEIEAWRTPQTHIDCRNANRKAWDELFTGVEVQTPDEEVNRMMNVWNKFQLTVNFSFGRGPSYYHKGQYPAMRDSCQDAFGMIPLDPDRARKHLLRIAGFFFADGQACGGCNRAGLAEGPAEKVDLPLWFVMAVADYARETGDLALLDESVPLMDGGESTVYQKMIRGIDRMIDQRGPHGLPLMGKGDWNDAANNVGAKGRGESVWLAQFLYFIIGEITPFMELRGDGERLKTYQARAAEIREIVNDHCWDGDWFVRAFRDDGRPLGVKGEEEGFIWLNSQTWAVISGIADEARLRRSMESTEKYMGTPYGLTNLAPAYTKFDESIGIITAFRPAWKENAAVFSHASSFNVVARAMLGHGRDAVDLYTKVLPSSKSQPHYKMEPYIYSQFCAGPAAGDDMGEGAFHWLTGTAAWMFRAMLDHIIGVHPELDGLRIEPAVDPTWHEFRLKRVFRGCVYTIEFSNPDGVECGVREVRLDGEKIDGTLLPLPTAATHHVQVAMG